MDNYFISYSKSKKKYIIPEISIISNDIEIPQLTETNENPMSMDAYRATIKFNPHTRRMSHPIDLQAFVYGPDSLFYEVIEGLYMLKDGTIKLKVKTKYGQ